MKILLAVFLLCLSPAMAEEYVCDSPPVCFGVNWPTATIADIDGIDVNARDKEEGLTPLSWASATNDNPEIISALINAGADVNARDNRGATPLHWGAMNKTSNNFQTISALVNIGADVNARDKDGFTPLHAAALLSNSPKIIEALLKVGSNPKAKANAGSTAYDLIQKNEKLKDTSAYWKLHDLSFE